MHIKYARKLSFLQYLCGCYMYNYSEDRTDMRLCEPLGSICPEPSPESVHLGGFTFVQGGFDIENLLKSPLIYSIP